MLAYMSVNCMSPGPICSLAAEEHTDIREEEKPCASKPSTSSHEKMEKLITIEAEEEEEEDEEEKEEEEEEEGEEEEEDEEDEEEEEEGEEEVEEEEEEEEEGEEEVVHNLHTDDPPCCTASCSTHETGDSWLEETGGHPGTCDEDEKHIGEAEDRRVDEETETTCQEMGLEKKQGDVNLLENPTEADEEETADDGDEEEIQEGVIEEDGVICRSGFWEELEDVICEVIEESEQVQREVERAGEQGEQHVKGSGEKREEEEEGGTNKTEGRIKVEEQSTETAEEKLTYSEEKETSKLQVKSAAAEEAQHQDRDDETTRETENRRNDKETADEQGRKMPNARSDPKTVKCEESDRSQEGGGGGGGGGGFGRKLVISKHPKVYQARAVPVVPPKPQHCKITAMTLRQQQREQRGTEGGGENTPRVQAEQERVSAGEQGKDGGRREKERRRDGEDTSRNSPLSMCFDEAVAIATMRREKERGSEKEWSRDQGGEVL